MKKKMDKRNNNDKTNQENFFNEMAYEIAGDLGAVDNEEMVNSRNIITSKNETKRKNK